MVQKIVYALIVGIVVFLLAWLVLGLLTLPTHPWAALLGVLAGVLVFLNGRL